MYPEKVDNGMITASMTFAIKDLVSPQSTYEEFLNLLKRDGLSKFGEPRQ
jgi:predicted xylose isomerase-like sugar epimerase